MAIRHGRAHRDADESYDVKFYDADGRVLWSSHMVVEPLPGL